MTRHFRTLLDFSPTELLAVLDRAADFKRTRGTPQHPKPLANKSIAVLFDKASTRTRLSFEVGIHELGGQPLIVISKDTQLGRGEPIEDTARMLARYCHAVVWRTFAHVRIETLAAKHSSNAFGFFVEFVQILLIDPTRQKSAIDDHNLAGYITGGFRCKKNRCTGQFFDLSKAAHRCSGQEFTSAFAFVK